MLDKLKGMFKQDKEETAIKTDECIEFIESFYSKDIKSAFERAVPLADGIIKNCDEMKKIAEQLDKAEALNQYSIVVKKKFCERIKSFEMSMPRNFEELILFRNSVDDYIRTINNTNIKEIVHLHLFKQDIDKIANIIKSLMYTYKKLNVIISAGKQSDIETIKSMIRLITDHENRISELNRVKQSSVSNIEALEKEYDNMKADLEKLNSSNEMNEFNVHASIIKSKEEAYSSSRSALVSLLSGAERPVRKYLHTKELSKDTRLVLEMYLENPIEAVYTGQMLDIMRDIAASARELGIEHKEIEKLNAILDKAVAIETSAADLQLIKKDIEKLNEYLESRSAIALKKQFLEDRVKDIEKETDSMKNELNSWAVDESDTFKKIITCKQELQDFISKCTNKAVKIID